MKNEKLKPYLAKLDTKQGRQIVALVTLVIAIYMGMQVIKPAYDATNTAKKSAVSTKQQTQTKQKEYETLLPKLQSGKTLDVSTTLNRALPSKVIDTNILTLLTNLASQVDVQIPVYQPGVITPGANYQTTPVTMNVQGTFSNCIRFLSGLQGMVQVKKDGSIKAVGPIWNVKTLNITTADDGSSSMAITADMYSAPADTTATPGGTS